MKKSFVIFIVLVFVVSVSIYLTFLYYPKCKDLVCWNAKLEACSRATFIYEPVDVTWEYTILGEDNIDGDKKCKVKVLAIDIKRGLKKTEVLEGKDMICYTNLGIVKAPESNPSACQGRLKEEMQSLIIDKLHEYIIQNLGEISKEAIEIEGVTKSAPNGLS